MTSNATSTTFYVPRTDDHGGASMIVSQALLPVSTQSGARDNGLGGLAASLAVSGETGRIGLGHTGPADGSGRRGAATRDG